MRVLIVEDEPELLQVLQRTLEESGYAVDAAADGEEGLQKALDWEYDALVLDVMLPKLDGWQVLERLRKQKATPVLMLTARDAVRDRVRGLDAGADDYLVKPFEISELLARLRSIIRRGSGKASAVLEIGEFQVDTAGARRTQARRADRSDAAGVRPGRVIGHAPRRAGHANDDLQPPLRRNRRYAFQSRRRPRFEFAEEARQRSDHHAARPGVLDRCLICSMMATSLLTRTKRTARCRRGLSTEAWHSG